MYASIEYYKNIHKGTIEADADIERALIKAGRHIDTLTFNRIVGVGFDNLTEFQQGIIKECACLMADWESENADYIDSMLSSYSLNGASMSFSGSSASATVVQGVAVSRDIYSHLQKCGLCTRSLRGW